MFRIFLFDVRGKLPQAYKIKQDKYLTYFSALRKGRDLDRE